MRVIYIAGASRSGSTLLEQLLGQIPGIVSVGEAMYLWRRGMQEGWSCGCGEPLTECAFWAEVLGRLEESVGEVDPARMEALRRRLGKNRALPLYLLPFTHRWVVSWLRPYGEILRQLYQAIGRTAGASLIVDSSKNPGYGFMLNSTPGIEVNCVHLVRDPRAVAFSWSAPKVGRGQGHGDRMPTQGPITSGLAWMRFTLGAEALCANVTGWNLRLKYEDLVDNPAAALEILLAREELAGQDLGFLNGRWAHLEPTHSVSGNPDRLARKGRVEIRGRDGWRQDLSPFVQLLLVALTWPQMIRYGYRR